MATKRTAKKASKATKRSSRRRTRVAVYDATQDKAKEASVEAAPAKKRGRKPAASKAEGRQRKQYDLAPGSTLTRTFKGQEIKVKVTADGFLYEGETYKSISALARHIVGYQISGPVFFGLTESSSGEATS